MGRETKDQVIEVLNLTNDIFYIRLPGNNTFNNWESIGRKDVVNLFNKLYTQTEILKAELSKYFEEKRKSAKITVSSVAVQDAPRIDAETAPLSLVNEPVEIDPEAAEHDQNES